MRTGSRLACSALVAAALVAPVAGAAAVPTVGAQSLDASAPMTAVERVQAGVLPAQDELPSTRMRARITGPMQFGFMVRPKLPRGQNWRVVLKVKECGQDKEWIVAQRASTKRRQEVFNPDGMRVIRRLMRDDGQFSGVRAYRLITPEQRGHARTVKTFRNYPLDPAGLVRIGTC